MIEEGPDFKHLFWTIMHDAAWAMVMLAAVVYVILYVSSCTWAGRTGQGIPWFGPNDSCGRASDPMSCSVDLTNMLDITIDEFEKTTHYDVTSSVYHDIASIHFSRYRPDCSVGGEQSTCHGVARPSGGKWNIYLKTERCVAITSLAHEVLHILQLKYMGDIDGGHMEPIVWAMSGKENSIEYRAVHAGILAGLCNTPDAVWMIKDED